MKQKTADAAVALAASMLSGRPIPTIEEADSISAIAARIAKRIHEPDEAPKDAAPKQDIPRCPYGAIYDLFRKRLPRSPAPVAKNEARGQRLKTIWRSDERYRNLEFWDAFFGWCNTIDWMTGEKEGFDPVTIDTLIRPSNFPKYVDQAVQTWQKQKRSKS